MGFRRDEEFEAELRLFAGQTWVGTQGHSVQELIYSSHRRLHSIHSFMIKSKHVGEQTLRIAHRLRLNILKSRLTLQNQDAV